MLKTKYFAISKNLTALLVAGSLFVAVKAKAAGVANTFFDSLSTVFDSTPGTPAGSRKISELITSVIEIALFVSALVALVFLIVGGFRYILAHGNEEQAESAKKTVQSALLGLVIIILSFAIVRIVSAVLIKGEI